MAPLQLAVYWRLSLIHFFVALLFFLDVFAVNRGSCASAGRVETGRASYGGRHRHSYTANASGLNGSLSGLSTQNTPGRGNDTGNQNGTVCMDEEVLSYGQTMYMSGLLLGSLFGGALSDRYGKKVVLLVCVFLHALSSVLPAALPHAILYLSLRGLTGLACCCINICSFSLGVEWSLPSRRVWLPALLSFSFSLGMMALAPLAYLTTTWAQLHLALGLPQLLCLPLYLAIPESPRWLHLRGRTDVLEKYRAHSLKDKHCLDLLLDTEWSNQEKSDEQTHTPPEADAHKQTHTPPEADAHKQTHTPPQGEAHKQTHTPSQGDAHNTPAAARPAACAHLSPTILLRLAIMSYIGLASALTYFGICLNIGSFGVDVYLAQFFSGLSEVPCLFVPFLLVRVGRRPISMLSLLLSGAGCLTSLLVSRFCDLPAVVMALALVGKLCMQITHLVWMLYTIEMFPTIIRQKCVGLVNLCYRVGCILNAVVSPRGGITLAAMVVYGSGPIVGAGLCLLLPETSGVPLPDSVEDCDRQPRLRLPTLTLPGSCHRRHSPDTPGDKATPMLAEKDPERPQGEREVFTCLKEADSDPTAAPVV